MRHFRILWVTRRFARVLSAIEGATAFVGALERPNPALYRRSTICSDM